MKLDAKMTFGQAQRKEKDPWTTNPLAMTLKLNDIISAGIGQFPQGTDQYETLGTPICLIQIP